ncbi:hypothetical protein [Agrococcus baldri]|uniref:Uncharacterized protein n=1 Tax=Agrococcus baldri TaxID=153730 RepID=A0AA87RHM5_9MICO|nr:hypothetical protein [Agrococcus baldri]GEK80470.1 hypothetical protein ABA31_18210 [Agrococcus baldri]
MSSDPAGEKPIAAPSKATTDASAKAGRAAAAEAGAGTAAGGGGWLGRAAEKVPTKWLTAAVVALFLAATAAFGGLEPVAAQGPVEVAAGEAHEGPMVSLAPQRAVLIDDFVEGGASADAEEHERVLVVIVDAVNVWDRPVGGLSTEFRETLRLQPLPELPAEGVARFDDGTIGPDLQPGVPVQLAVSWLVPDDAFAEGDELRLELFDHTLHTGQSVTYGEFWDDAALAAVATLEIEDVGAGADAEQATP